MAIDPNKTEFTAEELALVDVIFDKYINMQSQQVDEKDIVAIITEMWQEMGLAPPEIFILPSPMACKKACPNPSDYATYWNMWLCSYAATYEFAAAIGVEFDQEKYRKFQEWCRCCPFILFNDTTVYASRKPDYIKFNDQNQLHCDDGMACQYPDGWGVYSINGVSVDEQIVMSPETQTIEQMLKEENEEVKRIRISRYGWGKFLDQTGASIIDQNENDIEGTKEFLMHSDKLNLRVLACVCPSTTKEFLLEVPPETQSCREAQSWLSNGFSNRIISAS